MEDAQKNCQKAALQTLLAVFPASMTEATTHGTLVRDTLLPRAIKAMVALRQDPAIAGEKRKKKVLGQKSWHKISNQGEGWGK